MLANYHTHTVRCNHASGKEKEYIENAIKNGFKVLGFSDHVPQPYPKDYSSHIRMSIHEIEDYTNTLVALRDEYAKDIEILIGYEVEFTHKYFERMLYEIKKYPVDYIIQGQHFIPDEIDGFYSGAMTEDVEDLKAYVEMTVEGMNTGLFSYLAHPDLINFVGPDEIFQEHMSKIVETSIAKNIPLEVNMLGFMTDRNYPSDRFYSMASKMGAKFVIGCDAHNPLHVMQPEAIDGFTSFLNKHNIKIGNNIIDLKRL